MATAHSRRPLVVIGVGNPLRGDDGVGSVAALAVQAHDLPGVSVRRADGDLAGLVDLLSVAAGEGADVLLIDAIVSGATPGTLHRIEAHKAPLPSTFSAATTHGLGVAQAIELCRVLGCLPQRVVVYGVEAGETAIGARLSPPVQEVLASLVAAIVREARQVVN